jgi:hypothetical protein
MNHSFWRRQQADKPLFDDLLWSRPEHKNAAGKLLIVGGNLHAFAAPAEAYVEAGKAGVGSAHVLLPDAIKKMTGGLLEHIDYAPSTPSGSFAQKALSDLLEHAAWADAVLIAGDLGRNSETAILLESFAQKYSGMLCLTKDALDYATTVPGTFVDRPNTLLVPSFAQLQKLAARSGFTTAFTFDMDLLRFVDALHNFTQAHPAAIVVQHMDQTHCAVGGRVTSTPLKSEQPVWRIKTAAHATTWWMQNPTKPLEALTTSTLEPKTS